MRQFLILLAPIASAWAQPACQPLPSTVLGSGYPCINPDRTVTFRVRADNAKKVSVEAASLGYVAVPHTDLVKQDDGTWMGTTPKPMEAGFYYYTVGVDGFWIQDLGTQAVFSSDSWGSSGLEVPGVESDFFAVKDVPHGVVRHQWYFSKSTNTWRDIFVYTPPDYDQKTSTRYPVLYLQHGAGENNTGWSNQGHENFILDNLIAAGKAKPMIIVNETGTIGGTGGGRGVPSPRGPAGRVAPAGPGAAGRGASAGPGGTGRGANFGAFEEVVLHELTPYIDSTFRTLADNGHRALAGLSMGGSQALSIGLTHPEAFNYVGAFSPRVDDPDPKTAYHGRIADASAMNKQFKLIWIGIGTEDFLHDGAKLFHDNLQAAGIKHVWVESEGYHVWTVWRKYLFDFAPRLF